MIDTPVSIALTHLGIPHRQFTHPDPVRSLEQAAAERGQRPTQVVRSILFRLGADRFAMVLVAGPDPVAWKALRQTVGQSRLTTATEEEVLHVTGYAIGAVSPFGLPQPVTVFVDEGVLMEEDLSIGSGVRGTTIILRSNDLMRALPDAVVGNFRAASSPA
jgi:Cys-tRNA(Pro) deacylase